MSTRSALARKLGVVAGFDEPTAALEQYPTPPELAAHIVHVADLQDDLAGRTVVDLGTGTGMLALAAALRGPEHVIGIELDCGPLSTAQDNEARIATESSLTWVQADATTPPLEASPAGTTVVMNPPFGAQDGNRGADREFLETARSIASVSYSVHNAGSESFLASYVEDAGGEITHAYEAPLTVDRQFAFHDEASREIDVEIYRIDWT